MKLCTKCNINKELTEFYPRPDRQEKVQSYCKDCFNQYCTERWKQAKIESIEYKGGKCIDCNGIFHYSIFEFHHRDPEQKDLNWRKLRMTSKSKREAELDKCDLLCANCHRLRH
jgi:hypothetical protein